MQDTLQQQVFDYIKSAAEKIGEFAANEIPPFVEEFLTWKFWEASIEAAFWGIPVLVSLVWLIFYCKKTFHWAVEMDKNSKSYDSCWILIPVVSTCAAIAMFFLCAPYSQIKDMIQIKVAPKVYLLEQAAKIIKQ